METALCLTIWFLFGFWGFNIMKNKNRNSSIGIALGVLFGIFGIIACYCWKKKVVEKQILEG